MTNSELQEWEEYTSINPLPADTQEMQLATIGFLISSSNGGKSKFNDFLISGKEPKKSRKKLGGIAKQFMKQWENIDG